MMKSLDEWKKLDEKYAEIYLPLDRDHDKLSRFAKFCQNLQASTNFSILIKTFGSGY